MEKATLQGALHCNFILNLGLEQSKYLSTKDKNNNISILDSVKIKLHRSNESYARFSYNDDGDWKITGWTTFGEKNQFGFHIDVPTLSADETTMTIYPNPVENELYFALPWDNCSSVSICNITGNILLSKSICNGDSVDVSGLKAGIYFVAVQTPDGYVTAKLIKK